MMANETRQPLSTSAIDWEAVAKSALETYHNSPAEMTNWTSFRAGYIEGFAAAWVAAGGAE
jgi:hypothetical protein